MRISPAQVWAIRFSSSPANMASRAAEHGCGNVAMNLSSQTQVQRKTCLSARAPSFSRWIAGGIIIAIALALSVTDYGVTSSHYPLLIITVSAKRDPGGEILMPVVTYSETWMESLHFFGLTNPSSIRPQTHVTSLWLAQRPTGWALALLAVEQSYHIEQEGMGKDRKSVV